MDQGFGFFDFSPDEAASDKLNQRLFRWLENQSKSPFFLYAHALDPHEPYTPPPGYRKKYAPDVREEAGYEFDLKRVDTSRGKERRRPGRRRRLPREPDRISRASPPILVQIRDDLAEDRDRDLGRRDGADIEPDRSMDACEIPLAEPGGGEALHPPAVGFLRTERPDIEAIGFEGRDQRRVVQLRVVGEGHHRRAEIGLQRGEGLVRPIGAELDAGKALIGRKGAARHV